MTTQGLMGYIGESGRMPKLARAYVDAHRKHGVGSVWVNKTNFKQFRDVEDKLRKSGISARDYADYTVSAYLDYMTAKGMNRVPYRMFLSDAARLRYLDYIDDTGRIDVSSSNESHVISSEYEFATMYIHVTMEGHTLDRMDVAPIMAEGWYEAMQTEGGKEYIKDVISMLRAIHSLNGAPLKSYDDIVVALMNRREDD